MAKLLVYQRTMWKWYPGRLFSHRGVSLFKKVLGKFCRSYKSPKLARNTTKLPDSKQPISGLENVFFQPAVSTHSHEHILKATFTSTWIFRSLTIGYIYITPAGKIVSNKQPRNFLVMKFLFDYFFVFSLHLIRAAFFSSGRKQVKKERRIGKYSLCRHGSRPSGQYNGVRRDCYW